MSEPTHDTTDRSPFTKPGFIISTALVIALIAAVVVIFFLPKADTTAQPAPASASASAPPTPATTSAAAEKSICGLPSTPEIALGGGPKSTWTVVGKMAAPTDPRTIGPGVTDADGFRSCFAHSPTGALYSAVNMLALGSSQSPALNIKLAARLLVPGTGADAAKRQAATMAPSTGAETTAQVRGFLITSYSRAEATVDLAFETRTGAFAHTQLSLRWTEGDWKVKPADDGTIFSPVAQLSDLSGFLTWSGV